MILQLLKNIIFLAILYGSLFTFMSLVIKYLVKKYHEENPRGSSNQ